MDKTVDVMVIENRRGAGDHAAAQLEQQGHRVHRCHEPGGQVFPCRGVTDARTCPISEGAQVALLVRHGISPRPTSSEQGVVCALRAGLPVVEDGPDVLDPFDPWISVRAHGDPGRACADAVQRALDPLRSNLRAATAPVLEAAGADPSALAWDVEVGERGVHLVATGPELDPATRSQLAVRAIDAARGLAPDRSWIDVSYVATSS
jgi:hypothetical protein